MTTEVHLSRLTLSTACRAARRDVANPYELHRTISRAFSAIAVDDEYGSCPNRAVSTPRADSRVIYRLDTDRLTGTCKLVVQSTTRPDWSMLPVGYAAALEEKQIGAIYNSLRNGMLLRFGLRANPTKRLGRGEASTNWPSPQTPDKRRRVDLRGDAELFGWLARKGDGNGFSFDRENMLVACEGRVTFKRHSDGAVMTFGSAVFDGVLVVTDAARFRDALHSGVGTGRAFGFGLIMLAGV